MSMAASISPQPISGSERTENKKAAISAVPSPINHSPLQLVETEGQLQVHTAPYRGSFSVVLSEALRAAGLGSKVMIVQFLRGGVNQGPKGIVRLCGGLEWARPNVPCCVSAENQNSWSQEIHATTSNAIKEMWELCKKRLLANDLDQLVLDEAGLAIKLGYINNKDFIRTLDLRPKGMDVILTGPSIPNKVMQMADQVTELRCLHSC